ncbi:MAG: helix-turn-helix domain-containing protein [Verrucomicrobia bacterium]|nr:helix-turn-helix domain-containing protein [Verrucomicrobiota bacterium]MBU1733998.1 helix-turn-helix domain-containing protein [Verrucomicrobiota bacterium]MBU1856652.1 helix-turn-helix domain-containing protein [Verrucomicrobiota bacterium]
MSQDIRFKIARQVAGLTQLRLAEAVGVRESLITRIESGRAKPDRETAEKIAQVLAKRPLEIGI